MRLARRFARYDPVDEADATCAVQAALVEKLVVRRYANPSTSFIE
jgi:hypothetical protein